VGSSSTSHSSSRTAIHTGTRIRFSTSTGVQVLLGTP
jgi:hypothetical protein